MEGYTPRPEPMYPGALTDADIRAVFQEAGDFTARPLQCGQWSLCAYAIDGITSGADVSEYVIKPIREHLRSDSMRGLYDAALQGGIYNAVASPCKDLDDAALKLVNGFCVVLFPGVGAIAFEVKTGVARGPSQPEVENTVKGPKDAFVETVRINTSLVRRHLRTPDLRLYETKVGRRSLTNVSVVWIRGITNLQLVERMKKRLDSIDIDGFITPSAVEEYVTGSRWTAFPLMQYTERPDKFCDGLLYTVFYLICFIVLVIVFNLIIRLLNLTFHLPILRGLNAFGGAVFGLAEVGVLMMVLLPLLATFADGWLQEGLRQSFLTQKLLQTDLPSIFQSVNGG